MWGGWIISLFMFARQSSSLKHEKDNERKKRWIKLKKHILLWRFRNFFLANQRLVKSQTFLKKRFAIKQTSEDGAFYRPAGDVGLNLWTIIVTVWRAYQTTSLPAISSNIRGALLTLFLPYLLSLIGTHYCAALGSLASRRVLIKVDGGRTGKWRMEGVRESGGWRS